MTAQIAAFAHDLRCFADADSFYATQQAAQGRNGNWVANFFVPSGLFEYAADQEEAAQSGRQLVPRPHAMFTGTVRTAQLLHNADGLDFWALSVETSDATLDVVAAPEVVQGDLRAGYIVRGSFYLSARLFDA